MKLAYRGIQQTDQLKPDPMQSPNLSSSPWTEVATTRSSPLPSKKRKRAKAQSPLEAERLVHSFCQSDWGLFDNWIMTRLGHLSRWFQKQRF